MKSATDRAIDDFHNENPSLPSESIELLRKSLNANLDQRESIFVQILKPANVLSAIAGAITGGVLPSTIVVQIANNLLIAAVSEGLIKRLKSGIDPATQAEVLSEARSPTQLDLTDFYEKDVERAMREVSAIHRSMEATFSLTDKEKLIYDRATKNPSSAWMII